LVDIGAATTDIAIFTEGSISYSSVLAIGARHVTNDLAIGLRISLESAEKIKLYLSHLANRRTLQLREDIEEQDGKKKERPVDEIDLTSLNLPEELRKVSQKTLVEGIIRPRMNEIFTMIGLEIKKSGFGGQTPAGIVITGGGGLTVGVRDCAKRLLAMPVRVGGPNNIKGIIDEVQSPAFATVVGLALCATKGESKTTSKFGLGGLKLPVGGGSKIIKKILSLIKSFIP